MFPLLLTYLMSFTVMCAISGRKYTVLTRCLIVWAFITNILVVLYTLNVTRKEMG